MTHSLANLSRRRLLQASVGLGAGLALPGWGRATDYAADPYRLTVERASAHLRGPARHPTPVWTYNRKVPGEVFRVRQGEPVTVVVANRLDEPTTVHWHGLRVPIDQDGVPGLSQAPIAPGAAHRYHFTPPDAGTFWYHPHVNTPEQMGRGLYGAFIVEEREPIQVDQDVVWILDDWRLEDDGTIAAGFDSLHEQAHGGRMGAHVTVNGTPPSGLDVRTGERVRLRLINAANARIFVLSFEGHTPQIIAYDGHPVLPHPPAQGVVILGPGMRVDLIVDAVGRPGERYAIRDTAYQGQENALGALRYATDVRREKLLESRIALPANPLAEPDFANARGHELRLQGGAMGRMREATLDGKPLGMRALIQAGKAWALNGTAAGDGSLPPLFRFKQGESYRITLVNETSWLHPMHLHGHAFRLLRIDDAPVPHTPWCDTVLVGPGQRVEVAGVADNPGDWLFHCHVLGHTAAGMLGIVQVV